MKRSSVVIALAAFLAIPAAWAGAQLTLEDGRVLTGETLERTADGFYLLTNEDGDVVTIPVEITKSVALLGGEDAAPTGLRPTAPLALAGRPEPIRPPKAREQLAAFGRDPAKFREGAVRGDWIPASGLGADVSDFHPAKWFQAPTPFVWAPTSAFRASQDVTGFNPVRWYKTPTDPTWWPKDSWRAPSRWFSSKPDSGSP